MICFTKRHTRTSYFLGVANFQRTKKKFTKNCLKDKHFTFSILISGTFWSHKIRASSFGPTRSINTQHQPFSTSCSPSFAVRTKVHANHAIPNSLFTSYAISGDDTDKTTSNIKPLVSQHILSETSIYNILHSSIKLLENHSIPEPEESVIHLLSHALNLDWETGYQQQLNLESA